MTDTHPRIIKMKKGKMREKSHDMCEFCEGIVEKRIIQARFHFKGQTIYVDRVPAWVCDKCGEQYFDAPVYKRLEEIAEPGQIIVSEKVVRILGERLIAQSLDPIVLKGHSEPMPIFTVMGLSH